MVAEQNVSGMEEPGRQYVCGAVQAGKVVTGRPAGQGKGKKAGRWGFHKKWQVAGWGSIVCLLWCVVVVVWEGRSFWCGVPFSQIKRKERRGKFQETVPRMPECPPLSTHLNY